MMPQLLSVHIRRQSRRPIWIPLPVLPALLVLSPILLLVLSAGIAACIVFHINALRALGTAWRIVSALPGTRFDFEQGRSAVLVSIR